MFETTVEQIVNKQIESGAISKEDRNIYIYGYQMLIEFGINIMTSILIAILFQAYWTVLIFTIAYLMIRGYVGGYHAKTSMGCFCISAGMLIMAVIAVSFVNRLKVRNLFFLLEIIFLPGVILNTPIPDDNKPITENERAHFNRKVKQLYLLEFLFEFIFWYAGNGVCALSILAVHAVLFIMVMADILCKSKR